MLLRLLKWLIRRLGVSTLLSLLLLLTALGSVILGLASVIRGFDTGLMLAVTLFGLLLGWALARSPLPAWLAGLIILALGSEAIIIRLGQLGQPLFSLLRSLANLAWGVWRWSLDGPPETTSVLEHATELWARLSTVLSRLFDWSMALATDQPGFDVVAATLIWSLTLWLAAAWAGWAVFRQRQPLSGLIPAGALLVVTLAYAPGKVTLTAIPLLLGAALLLIALVGYHTREQRWEATGTDFPLDLRLDVALTVIYLTAGLVTAATVAPSLSVRQIASFVQRLIGWEVAEARQLGGSLGLNSRAVPNDALEAVRAGGLPRNHLIGSGPELSEQVVMVINTGEPAPASPDQPPPRYYWRSITYDQYTGRGWFTAGTKTISYAADQPTILEYENDLNVSTTAPHHRILEQEVQVVDRLGGVLYAAGDLITANHDFSVAWRAPDDPFGATIDSTAYRAISRLPVVTENQLRQTGTNYPDWMRKRHLVLPDDVPLRVLTLARDLTATARTPYDQAKAIESYLRTFPYTLDLPAPPLDRDIVDYFLFDLQQGYCDYYATSMVVLARAAGLPARLAVGYINGTYDRTEARYGVSEAEAHSWTEIYFPGFGWVSFEPTAGRPAIERSEDQTMPSVPPELEANSAEASSLGSVVWAGLWWLILPGGLTLLAGGGIALLVVDAWRLRRLPPAEAVKMLYQRLYRRGQWLKVPGEDGQTPYEFAASLGWHLTGLAQKRRWGTFLAPAGPEIRRLTDLYVETLYSPHRPVAADQVQAIRLWRRLRQRLWLASIYYFSNGTISEENGAEITADSN